MLKKLISSLEKFIADSIVSHAIARVAELADALDLGSSTFGVWVRLPPRVLKDRVSKEARSFFIFLYKRRDKDQC